MDYGLWTKTNASQTKQSSIKHTHTQTEILRYAHTHKHCAHVHVLISFRMLKLNYLNKRSRWLFKRTELWNTSGWLLVVFMYMCVCVLIPVAMQFTITIHVPRQAQVVLAQMTSKLSNKLNLNLANWAIDLWWSRLNKAKCSCRSCCLT